MKWLKIRIGCMCQRCTCLRPYLATGIENNFMFFGIKERKKENIFDNKKNRKFGIFKVSFSCFFQGYFKK